ncbi:threonylcarbamoyl-AMP synthase [Candidatus Sumerlaeota bacterium]|nr:threonylcarbamoyl-AMP synthase [Candidatus Sumerlaeota bacterium]
MTKRLSTFSAGEFEAAIREGARLIVAGDVVAFPTETVYGLGADATSAEAVAKIFAAKGRPSSNPIIVHVSEWSQARPLVSEWNDWARTLADACPEGPLTLVLPASDVITPAVRAGGATIGIRVPAHPVAKALITAAGCPIAAPSANPSNQLSPTTAAAVEQSLAGRIPLIIDGGACTVGIESTVVDLTGELPKVLRPGMISSERLGQLLRAPVDCSSTATTEQVKRSPGMLRLHYAPRTPLILVEVLPPTASDAYLIGFAGRSRAQDVDALLPGEPAAAAVALYETLRQADSAGRARILMLAPPCTPQWDAIRDRVHRATGRGNTESGR